MHPRPLHVLTRDSNATGYECANCGVRAGGMDVLSAIPCEPNETLLLRRTHLAEQQKKLRLLVELKKEQDRLAHLASTKRQSAPPAPSSSAGPAGRAVMIHHPKIFQDFCFTLDLESYHT